MSTSGNGAPTGRRDASRRHRSEGGRTQRPFAWWTARRGLLGAAVFQSLATLAGCVELLTVPQRYAGMLDGTPFAGRSLLVALLLGVVVGGPQWAAAGLQLAASRWFVAAHTVAGAVMTAWIAAECLVLGTFAWPHAVWGGAGALQLLLVCTLLGAFRPQPGLLCRAAPRVSLAPAVAPVAPVAPRAPLPVPLVAPGVMQVSDPGAAGTGRI